MVGGTRLRRVDPAPRRWDCNSCGQSNPEGMINCPKCGAWRNPR